MMTERERVFKREISLIRNEQLRNFLCFCLDRVPEYFFHIPASSTGKYHPPYSLGEGGLVRHTKAVVQWYEDLQRWWEEPTEDEAIIALVLHDSHKNGLGEQGEGKYTIKNHAEVAAAKVKEWGVEYGINSLTLNKICEGISGHMGVWSSCFASRPKTQFAKKCSLADYCASRKIGFEDFQ